MEGFCTKMVRALCGRGGQFPEQQPLSVNRRDGY
jgi:hypothetical protein